LAATPGGLRFFVDENALGLGKALAAARRDVVHPGHRLLPTVPLGTLDPDWIPIVGSQGLVVIGRDRRIRTKPAELALLRSSGLKVLWISGTKDLTSWGYLVRLVRRWNDIEALLASRAIGPWFYGVGEARLSEIPV
jgi:hypothetical protein